MLVDEHIVSSSSTPLKNQSRSTPDQIDHAHSRHAMYETPNRKASLTGRDGCPSHCDLKCWNRPRLTCLQTSSQTSEYKQSTITRGWQTREGLGPVKPHMTSSSISRFICLTSAVIPWKASQSGTSLQLIGMRGPLFAWLGLSMLELESTHTPANR